jgi:mRNA interferase HigB
MVIIKKKTIADYCAANPKSAEAFWNWYKQTKGANWANFSEMKLSFNSVDAVGNDLYVFNIKGNHYRLIVRIIFGARTVFVKFIGSHNDYDEVNLDSL